MKVREIKRKEVPAATPGRGRRNGLYVPAVLGLKPRNAFQFTGGNSKELEKVRMGLYQTAHRFKRKVSTQKVGNELFLTLRG